MANYFVHYLNDLLLHLGKNAKKFSESLNFDSPERIYHILRGRNKVSSDLANIIVENYPMVNYKWLLTGEGEMLNNVNNQQIGNVENSTVVGANVHGNSNVNISGENNNNSYEKYEANDAKFSSPSSHASVHIHHDENKDKVIDKVIEEQDRHVARKCRSQIIRCMFFF